MSVRPLGVILPRLFAEDDDLLAAVLTHDRTGHGRARNQGLADFRLIAANHEHLIETDLVAVERAEHISLHAKGLSFGDLVLLSTRANDRVHKILQKEPRLVAQLGRDG